MGGPRRSWSTSQSVRVVYRSATAVWLPRRNVNEPPEFRDSAEAVLIRALADLMVLLHFCGRNQFFAAGKRSFAAVVLGRWAALPSLTAVSGFLCELVTTEAVEGFEQQENRYQADRDVNATAHSI